MSNALTSFISRQRILIVCAILALTTAALYAPVRDYDFIRFDDPRYVSENENIRAGLTVETLRWAATASVKSNWHPLTMLSHALDVEVFGMEPGPHHVVNVIFHIANTLLVFALLHASTGSVGRSAVVAGIFAFHPLHIESVAWISERKDVLSGFFGLLSLWAYVRYAQFGGRRRWLLVFIALALGLMSKSMLVTLPFVFLLFDYWPLERLEFSRHQRAGAANRDALPWTKLLVEKLPFLLLVIVTSGLTLWTQGGSGALRGSAIVSLPDRVANAAVVFFLYVGDTFWPRGLAIHYPHPNMPLAGGTPWQMWQILVSGLLFIGLCFLVVRQRAHRPIFTGWFWFVGMLVPTIGLIQVGAQSHADRYLYLPMVGLSVAVIWGLGDWIVSTKSSPEWIGKLFVPIALVSLVALFIASAQHLPTWRNSVTVFEQALVVSPTDTVVLNNLGNEMFDRGDFDAAIAHYRRALEIAPTYRLPRANLAVALEDREAALEAARMLEEIPQ